MLFSGRIVSARHRTTLKVDHNPMQCVFDISARNAGVFLSGVLFAAERLGLEILSIEIGMQPSRVNTHLDVVVQGANPEALLVEIKRLDGYVDVSFRPIAETM
ncbi:MAG: hypothetical protein ABI858_08060 [Pseudoxanthomonas sp.]